ncbi:hypothetical protein KUV80_15585 [Fictibacillus nanhaiensis]|uniref:hypothetical protein n=1 Tax=Fictibacillus nanhaiensis TaxID=742169 RepID=UPI001C947EFD|nr:hypothetical protein [Fictibacillus nanhaiensis]MBY6038097.1 hypothetical protein [Fictibacillus nanhaiensis]
MAKSRAKKVREKLVREGWRNPEENRSSYAVAEVYKCMATKTTKTKKDKIYSRKKERLSSTDYSGDKRFFYIPYTLWIS